MAPSHEPLLLLGSPTRKTTILCKALLVTLSLIAIIFVAAIINLQFTATTTLNPSDLCTNSPNPSSCHTIVSNALTATQSPQPSPLLILRTILDSSFAQLDTAIVAATELHGRGNNEPKQQASLADCLLLFDLSRDLMLRSVSGINRGVHTDVRTWLSAVLTNHDTCLDGLDGYLKLSMEAQLKSLMASASASLAVLNAASRSNSHDDVVSQVFDFPSWIAPHDRKLLEARSASDIKADVVVAKDGSGKYKTVQEAVDSAPDRSTRRYVIYVKKGVYKENVSIGKTKKNVMIVGDGMTATVITGSLNFVDGTTTFNSATVAAVGDGLILQDLKVENTAGAIKHQAVALRVGADQSVINRCSIDAYQDTLYAHSLRQFYRDCSISGMIDFIFGNAAVVLQNCQIIARRPMDNQQNLMTAQGRTDPNQNTGTSVQNCRVVPSSDLVPVKGKIRSYLGRPWKEYSRTVFMQSYIDDHINPKGWLEWSGDFSFKTLFYGSI
ncbi:hypothetical protein J5N97_011516 [Dioscorea zingiberensis]|uniref:Pectinesterase n=1 Tax=Dioscorea zingiberensis TaxID=325984 RepID=A0A9D5D164_9LILI|nr:hypothetical protein J5N97_011516 [Dioscorea zingiberensis]